MQSEHCIVKHANHSALQERTSIRLAVKTMETKKGGPKKSIPDLHHLIESRDLRQSIKIGKIFLV